MTRFAFVTWDGGGNLPPAIGIAQELHALGHSVRFLGYESQRAAIETRGFPFDGLRRSSHFEAFAADLPPNERLPAAIRNVWSCPEHLEDIADSIADEPTDVLVVDFLMNGALAFAGRTPIPVTALAHSGIGALLPPPESPMGAARINATNELRAGAGLPTIERLDQGFDGLLTLVTTIPELDPSAATATANIRYVGPVRERVPKSAWTSPWSADDDRPLVLISFSTTRLWDKTGRIANTLDALSDEPVRVLLLTGAAAEVGPLPANTVARDFVDHDQVLPLASVMITHCGHGTVTACLTHGVPMVGLPNPAADQPFLARRIEELGAGVGLPGEAAPEVIRAATRTILDQSSYREAARALGTVIRKAPGAAGAAVALEHLVQTGRPPS